MKTKRDIIEVLIDVLQYFDENIHDVDSGTHWIRRLETRWSRDEEYLADVTVNLTIFGGDFLIDARGRDGITWGVATETTTREDAHATLALRFPFVQPVKP
jgi:hypothetical protein